MNAFLRLLDVKLYSLSWDILDAIVCERPNYELEISCRHNNCKTQNEISENKNGDLVILKLTCDKKLFSSTGMFYHLILSIL